MRIKALFVHRKESYIGECAPELLCAVDEFTDDENPQWFEDECAKQLAAVGDDVSASAVITLFVPREAIEEWLYPTHHAIVATVEPAQE